MYTFHLNDLSVGKWAGPNVTYWYRAEGMTYAAPLDEYDEPQGSGRSEIAIYGAAVVRETPKGVWLAGGTYSYDNPRFVKHDSRKKWAYPTKADALRGLIAKKNRQIKILNGQVKRATLYRDMAQAALDSGKVE